MMDNLKQLSTTYLGLIFKAGLVLVILSTLFLFTNLTTEYYETAKFLVLFIFTSIILMLLTLRFTITGKVVLIRTPLDIPLILLLVVGIVSTFLSSSPYVALLGNQTKVHGSLASLIVYVLFYFVCLNSLKTAKETKWIINIVILASGVLSAITLAAYWGLTLLPPPWTHGVNFSPAGSSFSTAAILALLIPILISNTLHGGNLALKTINSIVLFLAGTVIVLTGSLSTWVAAGFALGLTLLIFKPVNTASLFKNLNLIHLIVPLVLVLFVGIASFMPVASGTNLLYQKAKNFPREIQLPFVTSWKVSVSAFRDSPFWGSGPSSYLFNFTSYKPVEYNQTRLWNVRFDSAFNEYLEVLANLGGVGIVALLSLTALFISVAYKTIFSGKEEFQKALAIGGLTFFVILALHPSTLALWVIGILILAAFMAVNVSEQSEKKWGESGIGKTFFRIAGNLSSSETSSETIRIDALPGILLVISAALVLTGGYFAGKFALADYHHRLALNAVTANNGIIAYNELVAAEKLNPYNDLYRTDIAQTNFALANAIASAKAPTESSPAGSLTDTDKQNIQVLLQQSVNEARTAVTLSPRSAVNWEILGLLYRQIAGVAQNALVFSLDSYGRAIFQDPLNPALRLSVGGTYYAVKNYDLAIRFFTDAINLKPDYANGYYNLSVALRDKGDLNSALAAAQKVVDLVEPKEESNPDYKVASDYLNDLKTKAGTPETPPAAQTEGALKEEKLPDVVDVGQPPAKIATPEAIKKPASRGEPSPSPSPKP